MTPQVQPAVRRELRGAALWLARVAWSAATLAVLGLLAASQPSMVAQILGAQGQYARFGFTRGVALAYFLTLNAIPIVSFTTAAGIIFWRRSSDMFVGMVALMLITFSVPLTPSITTMSAAWVSWLTAPLTGLGQILFLAFWFLFPDGHFVPAWSRWLLALLVGLGLLVMPLIAPNGTGQWQGGLVIGFVLVLSLAGVVAQFYRYRYVSTPAERQQTKWVVAGVVGALIGLLLCLAVLVTGGDNFAVATVVFAVAVVCLLLIPASLAVSILRYRLWDIDHVVRRTAVYSLLSALLALAYFSLVVVLQGAVTAVGGARSEWITVASTLAVAALFLPLRTRVQAFIDRRFYRRKYDAARVLSSFAVTARDETDLETLTGRLAQAAAEAMQPETISVWLLGGRDRRRPAPAPEVRS